MVFYFTSHSVKPPVVMYMGRDKYENEELIKYSWPEDIWFHVDDLSSAHVYLRLPPGMAFEDIDKTLVQECSQLVKANSIQGCKLANVDIVYTPASNLKKTGDMVTGQVSFHNMKLVKKLNIEKKNEVWKRLDKTRVEKETRDFVEERQRRDRDEIERRKVEAKEKIAQDKEDAKRKREQEEAQSFKELFEHTEAMRSNRYDGDVDVNAIEEDFL